ncbi:MmpS family transport accessory protein [Streptomyces sp. NPDC047097]|uniref:MmpS family transport accessory protein n=1 Tax=Streptomyces sp. NPDC047097 TaxID=3155260 RepID=UPI0033D76CA8
MNRISRSVASVLVAGGLVLGLGACSEIAEQTEKEVTKEVDKAVDEAVNEEYEVTYEVTGEKITSIEFNAGGGKSAMDPQLETVENPTLPWTKTVKLRGIEPPSVAPNALDVAGDGKVTCKIIYKGKAIAEESGTGYAAAGGCVAVSPIAS